MKIISNAILFLGNHFKKEEPKGEHKIYTRDSESSGQYVEIDNYVVYQAICLGIYKAEKISRWIHIPDICLKRFLCAVLRTLLHRF